MGSGTVGRGYYRNYYKGHMDEPRGRVERGEGGGFTWGGVEGWREKAYNCNCITIKIFLKSGEFGCHHSEETTKGANGPR